MCLYMCVCLCVCVAQNMQCKQTKNLNKKKNRDIVEELIQEEIEDETDQVGGWISTRSNLRDLDGDDFAQSFWKHRYENHKERKQLRLKKSIGAG